MPLKVPEFSVFRSNHEKRVQGAFHVVDEGDVFDFFVFQFDFDVRTGGFVQETQARYCD